MRSRTELQKELMKGEAGPKLPKQQEATVAEGMPLTKKGRRAISRLELSAMQTPAVEHRAKPLEQEQSLKEGPVT